MIVKHLRVKNWRNFQSIDTALQERQFLVGPNASGKSNFLDIFRFLRDVAKTEGGGMQKALKDRGGLSKIRCFAARKDPEVSIEIELAKDAESPTIWIYAIGIKQENKGTRNSYLSYEKVTQNGKLILERPNTEDKKDPQRLTQTFLEQIGFNAEFRPMAKFLQSINYLHLVPQLLRYADRIQGRIIEDDPFGQSFLERIAKTPEKTRRARLKKIEEALKIAVPQLQQLEFMRDSNGKPHLQATYQHWRPKAGLQKEDQFSDGTLRLIAFIWSLLEGDSPLLLEEPELSLNSGIVAQLAPLMYKAQRVKGRQLIISTHSEALLSDGGIDGAEVLMLVPKTEGTKTILASDDADVRNLLSQGFGMSEVVLDSIKPEMVSKVSQLTLF
ncbi:MAG: putative ATPase [Parcubacteria group bacterium]|nr:putative ATPase [Parcubacteria group bacterium]